MITLDHQEMWFLNIILLRALDNHDLFLSTDENEFDETFDKEFYKTIKRISDSIDKTLMDERE